MRQNHENVCSCWDLFAYSCFISHSQFPNVDIILVDTVCDCAVWHGIIYPVKGSWWSFNSSHWTLPNKHSLAGPLDTFAVTGESAGALGVQLWQADILERCSELFDVWMISFGAVWISINTATPNSWMPNWWPILIPCFWSITPCVWI